MSPRRRARRKLCNVIINGSREREKKLSKQEDEEPDDQELFPHMYERESTRRGRKHHNMDTFSSTFSSLCLLLFELNVRLKSVLPPTSQQQLHYESSGYAADNMSPLEMSNMVSSSRDSLS